MIWEENEIHFCQIIETITKVYNPDCEDSTCCLFLPNNLQHGCLKHWLNCSFFKKLLAKHVWCPTNQLFLPLDMNNHTTKHFSWDVAFDVSGKEHAFLSEKEFHLSWYTTWTHIAGHLDDDNQHFRTTVLYTSILRLKSSHLQNTNKQQVNERMT